MNPRLFDPEALGAAAVRASAVEIAAVAAGGALGALLRHGLTRTAVAIPGGSTVWGTLLANLLGCFLIGLLAGYLSSGRVIASHHQLAIRTGFLGSLTTFSTFALEAYSLAGERNWLLGFGYVLLTLVLGLVTLAAGFGLAQSWQRAA